MELPYLILAYDELSVKQDSCTHVRSGSSVRIVMRELGAVNVKIEVFGSVRGTMVQHQSTALENAVDDSLGQIGVMEHRASQEPAAAYSS